MANMAWGVAEVGNVVESVEVSAGAQLLETETATTGHLVSGTELTTLHCASRRENPTLLEPQQSRSFPSNP